MYILGICPYESEMGRRIWFSGPSIAIKSTNFAFVTNPSINYQDVTAGSFAYVYRKRKIFHKLCIFPYFLLVLLFFLLRLDIENLLK